MFTISELLGRRSGGDHHGGLGGQLGHEVLGWPGGEVEVGHGQVGGGAEGWVAVGPGGGTV